MAFTFSDVVRSSIFSKIGINIKTRWVFTARINTHADSSYKLLESMDITSIAIDNFIYQEINIQILTLENKTFFLNDLPEEVDDDLRFNVLDNSDNQNPDYFFIPLIFLESFTGPAAVLKVGPYDLTMPLD
jgi:hypothetical protein